MDQQQTYEREIDLVRLFRAVIKKWKMMLYMGIVGCCLFAAVTVIVMVIKYNNPEEMEYQRAEYQDALNEYNYQMESLSRGIDNIETGIVRQEEYNSKSVLMKIDPFNVQNGVLQYYIDTGYQINTDKMYQNPDNTNSVLNAYATNVSNGGLWKYIQDNIVTKMEFRYIQELVRVSVDYNNAMINVSVKHRTTEECEELISIVKACLDGYHEEIVRSIGEHSMSLITESIYATVDLSLEDTQEANIQKVEDLNNALEEQKFELKVLEKEGKPDNTVITPFRIVINTIKFGLIGIAAGIFVAAAIFSVMYIMDMTVRDDRDVEFYLELPVLTVIPVMSGEEANAAAMKKNRKSRLSQYGGM